MVNSFHTRRSSYLGRGLKWRAAIHHAVGRAFGDRSTQHDLDPEFCECLARIGRKILWKDRQQTRASLDQYNPRCARVDRAEVTRQRVSCQLGDGSGQFNPGGTTTDDDERLQRGTLLRIARALSFLESREDSAPNGDRKSTRLNSSH